MLFTLEKYTAVSNFHKKKIVKTLGSNKRGLKNCGNVLWIKAEQYFISSSNMFLQKRNFCLKYPLTPG